MCLLTYFAPGALPDTTALRWGAWRNPHGHGYGIVTGGELLVGHGMDGREVVAEFAALRAAHPDGPALFHSRYATKGTIGLPNCHPFPLGTDGRTVVAHNGTLPKRVHPGAYDERSDTRIAAEDYLPHEPFGSLDTRRGRRGLESWLGSSKLVLLTVNPAYASNAYILNEDLGVWDVERGIWYSNHTYRATPLLAGRWLLRCLYCGHVDQARRGRYCRLCGWCFACREPLPDCECAATRIARPVIGSLF
ncbi:hypothetical protein [Nocardia puris]|uniref:hypothetical protein n=1 Tax=Nocardia puris TaxID=208602 RepID=UPI002E1C237A